MTVQAMTQVRMTSLISVLWFTWGKNKNVLTCGFNQADIQASWQPWCLCAMESLGN